MCGDARMFNDGQTVKVATCGDQGVWKPEVPDCVGRCYRDESRSQP